MAKTKAQKLSMTNELKELFISAKGVALMTFSKISVKADWELRKNAKKQGVEYQIAKKTLLSRATKELGIVIGSLDASKGNIGFAVSHLDEVAPAKLLKDFMKRQKNAVIAFLGGAVRTGSTLDILDANQVQSLAALPGKQEQLSMLVRTMQNPLQRFVGATSYPMRLLVQALKAIQTKQS